MILFKSNTQVTNVPPVFVKRHSCTSLKSGEYFETGPLSMKKRATSDI